MYTKTFKSPMKKLLISLLISIPIMAFAQAPSLDPVLIGASGVTGPTGTYNGLQIVQEHGTGFIGIGVNGSLQSINAALGVANATYSSHTAPQFVSTVYNSLISNLPSAAASAYSFGVMRGHPTNPTGEIALDFIVDNNGNAGFGTAPVYFGPYGTHFGIICTDNDSKQEAFSLYTNTNNNSNINLPALISDFEGSIFVGCGSSIANPARMNITTPFPTGNVPILSVFTNKGSEALFVASDGKVGVGNTTPAYALDISGTTNADNNLIIGAHSNNGSLDIKAGLVGAYGYANLTEVSGSNVKALAVSYSGDKFVVFGDGRTVIGGKSPATSPYNNYMLAVNGNIAAQKVMVETSDWADYVFDKNYKLPALSDVESYITANQHLPEVPSACDVTENGIDVGEMNKKLLQKVEELTLYVIQQQKEIDALKCKK